jgi:hypothetical protein
MDANADPTTRNPAQALPQITRHTCGRLTTSPRLSVGGSRGEPQHTPGPQLAQASCAFQIATERVQEVSSTDEEVLRDLATTSRGMCPERISVVNLTNLDRVLDVPE